MKTQLNIYTMILDQQERYHLLLALDTKENKADAYYLNHLLNEDVNTYDEQIGKLFRNQPDYHLILKAEALVKLTDQLDGIVVDKNTLNGIQALDCARKGKYMEVLDGIYQALLKKGNLLKIIPSLLSILKESYETDMPLMDILKIAMGEINDLSKWKVYIRDVNKDNLDKVLQ